MVTDDAGRADSLTERKRRRAKEAIRQAALELFTERGYDAVSVTDIAERAEVGRTTFFRYFGDKQEVLFPGADETATDDFPRRPAGVMDPIGSSLIDALRAARSLVVSYVRSIAEDTEGYIRHEQLINSHPELYARSLVKHRSYADRLTRILLAWGATPGVARQAAEMGLACFYVAQTTANDDPRNLVREVTRAFNRLDN